MEGFWWVLIDDDDGCKEGPVGLPSTRGHVQYADVAQLNIFGGLIHSHCRGL